MATKAELAQWRRLFEREWPAAAGTWIPDSGYIRYNAEWLGFKSAMQLLRTDMENSQRFKKLQARAQEKLLNPRQNEDVLGTCTHWVLPVLMCSGAAGEYQSFGDAVDALPEEKV